MIKRFLQPFYAGYVAVTYVICFISARFIMAVRHTRCQATTRKRTVTIARFFYKIWLQLIGMPVTVLGAIPTGRYIFVANHSSYIDSVIIYPAIADHFRTLGKMDMATIPLYGYFYRQTIILVDRDSLQSKIKSIWHMRRHLREEGSMLIFPEGTFNETTAPLKDFYDGAFHLAITTHMPIVPIIFPDAADRWHPSAWWKFWPGRNRAVYLPAVPVHGLTVADVPALKQQVYTLMEEALIKYRNI